MMLAAVAAQLAGLPGIVIDDTTALALIDDAPAARPVVAYVVADDENGQEGSSNLGYWLEQFVDIGIAVVVVVRPRAVRGGQAVDLETAKEAVKTRLIGWQPPGADRPTVFRTARLLGVTAGAMSMMLRFTVRVRTRVLTPGGN